VLLVPIQLNRAKYANPVQRMLKPSEFTMTIPKVSIDTPAARHMIRIVRVSNRESAQHAELRLDQIEPRRFGRRPDRLNAQPPQEREERRMVVDVVQVIHDDEQAPAWITSAEATEGFAHLAHAFAASKHPVETVGMDIVEAQELFDAVAAMVGRAPAHGLAAAGPGDAPARTDFPTAPRRRS